MKLLRGCLGFSQTSQFKLYEITKIQSAFSLASSKKANETNSDVNKKCITVAFTVRGPITFFVSRLLGILTKTLYTYIYTYNNHSFMSPFS